MAEQAGGNQEQQQAAAEMQRTFESINPVVQEVQEAMQSKDIERIKTALKKLKQLIDNLRAIAANEGLPPEARQQAAQISMQLEQMYNQYNGQLEG